jgi:hypothetical protein
MGDGRWNPTACALHPVVRVQVVAEVGEKTLHGRAQGNRGDENREHDRRAEQRVLRQALRGFVRQKAVNEIFHIHADVNRVYNVLY